MGSVKSKTFAPSHGSKTDANESAATGSIKAISLKSSEKKARVIEGAPLGDIRAAPETSN